MVFVCNLPPRKTNFGYYYSNCVHVDGVLWTTRLYTEKDPSDIVPQATYRWFWMLPVATGAGTRIDGQEVLIDLGIPVRVKLALLMCTPLAY